MILDIKYPTNWTEQEKEIFNQLREGCPWRKGTWCEAYESQCLPTRCAPCHFTIGFLNGTKE